MDFIQFLCHVTLIATPFYSKTLTHSLISSFHNHNIAPALDFQSIPVIPIPVFPALFPAPRSATHLYLSTYTEYHEPTSSSPLDLNLHHERLLLQIVLRRLLIMAVGAGAAGRALQPSIMTLTVVLEALALFTSALPLRYVGFHAFEGPRLPEIGHLLGQLDLRFVAGAVLAARADALGSAHQAFGEALAVEFQAADF